jgi:hypothetical protein
MPHKIQMKRGIMYKRYIQPSSEVRENNTLQKLRTKAHTKCLCFTEMATNYHNTNAVKLKALVMNNTQNDTGRQNLKTFLDKFYNSYHIFIFLSLTPCMARRFTSISTNQLTTYRNTKEMITQVSTLAVSYQRKCKETLS